VEDRIEAIFKKAASTGNLSSDNIDALVHEITKASELLEHITEYVPQHYSKYLILPRHQKAILAMQGFITETGSCKHDFIYVGQVVHGLHEKTNIPTFAKLKQCRFCHNIQLE
jgi:hypothetical protein